MTISTPNYRIASDDGVFVTLEFDLPGFEQGVTVMRKSIVGTPIGDTILRRLVAKRQERQDILRQEP